MAGLSAAETLVNAGFRCVDMFSNIWQQFDMISPPCRVTVLEAKDRLGGRMFTKSHGDGFIEFGAQGIHGAENKNSVFKFATDEGLLGSPPEIIETINGICTGSIKRLV